MNNSEIPPKGVVAMSQAALKRKTWIDGLRALAMLFVMYGHMVQGLTPFLCLQVRLRFHCFLR